MTPWELLATATGIVGFITSVIMLIKRLKKPKIKTVLPASELSLKKHSLFSTLMFHRNIITNKFNLESQKKTDIFRDILVNMVDIWGDLLTDLAEEIDNRCQKGCTGED